jgi:Tfp pilus assembly protein PilE
MKTLNNKGIALITALMMTLITLVIILGIMTLIANNTKATASHKAYRNATEAAYGGADLVMQDILPRLFQNISTGTLRSDYSSMHMLFSTPGCLHTKLNNPVSAWGASCSSSAATPDPKSSPDMKFDVSGDAGQSYTVYSKIIDTSPGVQYPLAPTGGQLLGGGVTESSGPTTTNLAHFVYRIEVTGERTVNAAEKSNLSVLYEY